MTQRQRILSGAPWEKRVGYCRAIRAGNQVAISGTTSIEIDGSVHAPGDGYLQAKRCLEIMERALVSLTSDRSSVVRTRMFVTNISRWEEFGKAHAEFFADCPPATSMLEVKSLIHPELLIEIEADAVLD